jgi:hypothetical protein
MLALGFALLLGLIATFALGCWLDRPLSVGEADEAMVEGLPHGRPSDAAGSPEAGLGGFFSEEAA